MRRKKRDGSVQVPDPLFVGRTVTAMLQKADLKARSGTIQWVEDLGEEFDVLDENGKRPLGTDHERASEKN